MFKIEDVRTLNGLKDYIDKYNADEEKLKLSRYKGFFKIPLKQDEPYVAEPPGLGLSKWWKLADTHRLYIPAVKHDCRYSMRMCGLAKGILFETSEHADKKFYEDCCKVCEEARKGVGELDYTYMFLKTEAEFFYSIVCVVGQYHWPEPLTDLAAIKAEMNNIFRCLEILKAAGETNVGLCGESI